MKTANLGEYNLYLFHHGTNYRAYEMLGAHFVERAGKQGVRFAVWAPHAGKVSVVGDFNDWDERVHQMNRLEDGETWEIFIEGLAVGDNYKYAIDGKLKADPYAFRAEQNPDAASQLCDLTDYAWHDGAWQESKKRHSSYTRPMLIYEVHAASWREGLNCRELAEELIAYVKDMHYTHIELMPSNEPYYAVASRCGTPDDLRHLIDTAHQNGIGVIMDWACGSFGDAAHGLREFDGTKLYEADTVADNGTLNFDYARNEVQSFLISNALFRFEEFHIDALRIDGVANMLYLNFDGEWSNLEAVEFLKKLNETVFKHHPQALMMAEESTSLPLISKPIHMGGMGFNYKWNMGWQTDMLDYVSLDPIYRKWNHDKITFSLMYAFTENFILPLSHNVKSLLAKMPGDHWQKFAGLRCFLGYWMAHPGKKLLFMGNEFGQPVEWHENSPLDWQAIDRDEKHAQLQNYSRALNKFYLDNKSLWQVDFDWNGFQWIDCNDNENSVVSFIRKAQDSDDCVIVVCNFTPNVRAGYRIGVPVGGRYVEVFNSDAKEFGGSGVTNPPVTAQDIPWHNRNHSIALTIPPLATMFLKAQ